MFIIFKIWFKKLNSNLFVYKFFPLVKNRIKYRNKCALIIQRTVRGYLVRKKHQPRIKGIAKIRAIKNNVTKMEEIANQLKGEREQMLGCVRSIQDLIDMSIRKIKVEPFFLFSKICSEYFCNF